MLENNIESVCTDPLDALQVVAGLPVQTYEDMKAKKILILPTVESSRICFAQETSDFYKYCNKNHSDLDIGIFTASEKFDVLSLRSCEMWLPVFYLAEHLMFPILVELIADYLKYKLRGKDDEENNVNFECYVNREGEYKYLKYRGPIEGFEKKFKSIDIEKF